MNTMKMIGDAIHRVMKIISLFIGDIPFMMSVWPSIHRSVKNQMKKAIT